MSDTMAICTCENMRQLVPARHGCEDCVEVGEYIDRLTRELEEARALVRAVEDAKEPEGKTVWEPMPEYEYIPEPTESAKYLIAITRERDRLTRELEEARAEIRTLRNYGVAQEEKIERLTRELEEARAEHKQREYVHRMEAFADDIEGLRRALEGE